MPGFLDRILKRSPFKQGASELYVQLVEQSRDPAFYTAGAVADTLDGRFDMISLHAVLLIRRIKRGGGTMEKPARDDLSQLVFDYMFDDMDRSLREMGVGDLTVGKRVKKMAAAFYGRASAYEEALNKRDDEPDLLPHALVRNLYREQEPGQPALDFMLDYIVRTIDVLEAQSLEDMSRGKISFATPEGEPQ